MKSKVIGLSSGRNVGGALGDGDLPQCDLIRKIEWNTEHSGISAFESTFATFGYIVHKERQEFIIYSSQS